MLCFEYRMLCFEYMQGGSLDKHIAGHTRYGIIKGICEGLNGLHDGRPNGYIFHLDLKPDIILLGRNLVFRIAQLYVYSWFHPRCKLCNPFILILRPCIQVV